MCLLSIDDYLSFKVLYMITKNYKLLYAQIFLGTDIQFN